MPGSTVDDRDAANTVFGWSRRAWGWCAPSLVAVLALVLRVWHLGRPNRVQFDETYYAKDAWAMLRHGYPLDAVDDADTYLTQYQTDALFTNDPQQFVHPPAGKWLIAAGEQVFGMNSFGWRVSAAVIGALTVLVLARVVLRLTGSIMLGSLAGVILSLDGLHFVMSRLALLDVFLAFWLVCGFACLVADRDWISLRLTGWRPWRPWQFMAGVCFGLACATKWSGIYPVAVFGIAVVGWEVFSRYRARREPASDTPWRGWIGTMLTVGLPAFVLLIGVALIVYLATWSSWLWHYQAFAERFGHGYGDHSSWGSWLDPSASSVPGHIIDAFRSLWHYHVMTYEFHTGSYLQGKTHPYQSGPAGWLVITRPVGVDAQNDLPSASCGAPAGSSCMREVLLLGNPVVWWSGALALITGAIVWLRTRDWRLGWAILAVLSCWLPWFAYTDRPIFSFYAVTIVPFTIVVMCLIVHTVARNAPTPRARYVLWLTIGAWVLALVIAFWFFHPVWTDALISHDAWMRRMWFSSWI